MVKNKRLFSWAMCLFFVFSGMLLQDVSANAKRSISFYGWWSEGIRSVSPTNPISAFVGDGVLTIHSRTQRSDITICISKDGELLYEEKILALNTDYMTIKMDDFDSGIYTVELKNQWGDCLWGEFYIQ